MAKSGELHSLLASPLVTEMAPIGPVGAASRSGSIVTEAVVIALVVVSSFNIPLDSSNHTIISVTNSDSVDETNQ